MVFYLFVGVVWDYGLICRNSMMFYLVEVGWGVVVCVGG